MFLKSFIVLFISVLILPFSSGTDTAEASGTIRIAGEDRYETAAAISKEGFAGGADTVVIARGDQFPDALTGAPLAYKLNAPILLSSPSKVPDATLNELKRLKAKKAVILGGPAAINETVKKEIEKLGMTTERIYGDTRYETSVKVAEKLGASKEQAIIATGKNFPDALAIAPYAAEKGYPILLTAPDKLSDKVTGYLQGVKSTIVIGGPDAIGTLVESKLPKPERISGATRYDTAAQILRTKYDKNSHIYISTGRKFADALTGSVLAAKNSSAIYLTKPDELPEGSDRLIAEKQMKSFNVYGGNAAVTDGVVSQLEELFAQFEDVIGTAVFTDGLEVMEEQEENLFENASDSIVYHEDESFSIKLPADQAQMYKKSDLFYLPPSDDHPSGFFGQVSDVQSDGTVTIDQPALDEVLKEFNIQGEEILTPDNLIDVDLEEGVVMTEGEQQFQSFSKWSSAGMKAAAGQKPIEFALDKTLFEKESNNSKVKLTGSIAVKSAKAKMDLKKKFGLITGFDYHFESKQDSSIKFMMEMDGKMETVDQSKNKEFGKWIKLEGVDREGRISLATMTYQIGTAPVFGVGNKGYIDIPIGVTVFVTTNVKGEAKLSMEFGVIEKSSSYVDVKWKGGSFDSDFDLTTDRYEAEFEGKGEITASLGAGFEPAINIGGLLPAVVQNDLSIGQELKGNVKASYDFKDNDFSFSGCFEDTFKAGFESNLKVRLKASSEKWNIEEKVEYKKKLYDKEFFKKENKYCEYAGKIKGNVVDAVSKDKLENVKVSAYQDGEFFNSAVTDENGDYELQLSDGTYTFEYSKFLYKKEKYENVKIKENEIEYSPSLRLIGSEFFGDGEASGQIKNSIDGRPVAGASIKIRSGLNSFTGPVKATTVSDASGFYKVTLPAGLYTAEVSKEGFITSSTEILSIGTRKTENQNATLSPILDQAKTRIVLKWGEQPYDLDSHLTGPAEDGNRFHLYFGDQDVYENDELMAQLDVDDTSSYGPETITINHQKDGVYRYSIHDFSNGGYTDSDELSKSGAVVEVYRGSYLVRTFHVPTNQTGTLWTVFELNGSTIVPINTVSNTDVYTQNSRQTQGNSVDRLILPSLSEKK
ncbi:cell wall-binding repeat-containing protein [Metabacillus indicus]|uniref:cell wall-binding repeat-containing protein n=1 Tax=Metabacillus indicus TaxID=246786 RepID=UPI001F293077|nr:cell wall-binding repeat-containing protein [Metabacillus indicus]